MATPDEASGQDIELTEVHTGFVIRRPNLVITLLRNFIIRSGLVMLKTRPRFLLGVIFFSVNIVVLPECQISPASIQLQSEVTVGHQHYQSLPTISTLTRSTHISVLINHHNTAFSYQPATSRENYFSSALCLIVIDWLLVTGLQPAYLFPIKRNLSDETPSDFLSHLFLFG